RRARSQEIMVLKRNELPRLPGESKAALSFGHEPLFEEPLLDVPERPRLVETSLRVLQGSLVYIGREDLDVDLGFARGDREGVRLLAARAAGAPDRERAPRRGRALARLEDMIADRRE